MTKIQDARSKVKFENRIMYNKADYYIMEGTLIKNRRSTLYTANLVSDQFDGVCDIEKLIKSGAKNIVHEVRGQICGYNLTDWFKDEFLHILYDAN